MIKKNYKKPFGQGEH